MQRTTKLTHIHHIYFSNPMSYCFKHSCILIPEYLSSAMWIFWPSNLNIVIQRSSNKGPFLLSVQKYATGSVQKG